MQLKLLNSFCFVFSSEPVCLKANAEAHVQGKPQGNLLWVFVVYEAKNPKEFNIRIYIILCNII